MGPGQETGRDGPRDRPAGTAASDRPRLFALLADPPPLTVVLGPRGIGKTRLLAAWSTSSHAPDGPLVAAAPPDHATDPAAYWDDVSLRIDSALEALDALGALDALAASGDRVTVILDGLDRLDDAEAATRVQELVGRSDRVRVVVTARGADVLGDTGLLDIDHTTITWNDLLLTLDESRAALGDHGIVLPPPLLETVQDLTGGFAPLVRIAGDVARPFAVDDRHNRDAARQSVERAVDRFVERVIGADPELAGQREFLTTIAAARTVTGPIAEMLTGDADAVTRLRDLETAGVLVRLPWPRDDEWQYLPPIRAALLRGVRRESPTGPLRASSALTQWFRDRGDVATALEYAVEAAHWQSAAELLKAHWADLVSRRFRLVRDTLVAIPADVAESDLAIRAGRDLFLRFGSDARRLPAVEPLEARLGASSPGSAAPDDEEFAETLAVGSVHSMILRVGGEYARAAALSTRMSALGDQASALHHDRVSRFLPMLCMQWGLAHLLHGDLTAASTEFRRAYSGNRPAGTDFVARNATGSVALGYALSGELGHADTWLDKERRNDDTAAGSSTKGRVGALIAAALVAIDRMELEVGGKILAELGDLPDDEELWAFGLYAHCRLALFTHQASLGLDRIHRTTAVYDRWLTPDSAAAMLLAAAEADLHLALGTGNEAWTTLTNARGHGPWTVIAHARMELSSGHPAEAIADCAQPLVSDCPYPRIRMESALIQAVAHLDLDDTAQAREMVQRAVALFEQTGLASPFASVPAARIAQLSELGVPLPSAWQAAGMAAFPDRVQLVGLSERETTVLAALVTTPSIADIATQLYVSQNTVKTQLRSLYRKLEVHSRADALATAARLGLTHRGSDA